MKISTNVCVLSRLGVKELSNRAKTNKRSMHLAKLGHFCVRVHCADNDGVMYIYHAGRPNKRMIRKSVKKAKLCISASWSSEMDRLQFNQNQDIIDALRKQNAITEEAVSYTHLTLPTICSV